MRQIISVTGDGSHTVEVPEMQVTYHSTHGALQESQHIFIEAGLKEVLKRKTEIAVFEMGFGTGLNALLTFIEIQNTAKVYYEAAELFPLDAGLAMQLNYVNMHPVFSELHACEWERVCPLSENFNLLKRKEDITCVTLSNCFDLVYFDAFDPTVQPWVWTVDVFRKLFSAMNRNGLLVTYCSKGGGTSRHAGGRICRGKVAGTERKTGNCKGDGAVIFLYFMLIPRYKTSGHSLIFVRGIQGLHTKNFFYEDFTDRDCCFNQPIAFH